MTDPLHIATLDTSEAGRLGLCRLPGLTRNLEADLESLTTWRPDIVVSMTTTQELIAAGSDDIGPRLEALGIAWTHMPIADFGGPEGASEEFWSGLSERVHSSLNRGGGVLFHCRGGRGRCGMMVLRVLIERGEDTRQALSRLRRVRPGAVETDEQLRWAAAVGPAPVGRGYL